MLHTGPNIYVSFFICFRYVSKAILGNGDNQANKSIKAGKQRPHAHNYSRGKSAFFKGGFNNARGKGFILNNCTLTLNELFTRIN
jgi:hypothetical protein